MWQTNLSPIWHQISLVKPAFEEFIDPSKIIYQLENEGGQLRITRILWTGQVARFTCVLRRLPEEFSWRGFSKFFSGSQFRLQIQKDPHHAYQQQNL
jgi:hypothetical protein